VKRGGDEGSFGGHVSRERIFSVYVKKKRGDLGSVAVQSYYGL
jgi:hypothetical protein